MYVGSGSASLARSNISNCTAAESGGGLYSHGGRTSLSDGTLISGCSAEGPGSSVFLLAGEVSYTLPAPAGRWLPNARCEVYRKACAYPPCSCSTRQACLENADAGWRRHACLQEPAYGTQGECNLTHCLEHRDD